MMRVASNAKTSGRASVVWSSCTQICVGGQVSFGGDAPESNRDEGCIPQDAGQYERNSKIILADREKGANRLLRASIRALRKRAKGMVDDEDHRLPEPL